MKCIFKTLIWPIFILIDTNINSIYVIDTFYLLDWIFSLLEKLVCSIFPCLVKIPMRPFWCKQKISVKYPHIATISWSCCYTGLVSTNHVHCYAGHLRQRWAPPIRLYQCKTVWPVGELYFSAIHWIILSQDVKLSHVLQSYWANYAFYTRVWCGSADCFYWFVQTSFAPTPPPGQKF